MLLSYAKGAISSSIIIYTRLCIICTLLILLYIYVKVNFDQNIFGIIAFFYMLSLCIIFAFNFTAHLHVIILNGDRNGFSFLSLDRK